MTIVIDLTTGAAGSTLADLRVQFRNRGFDHLDDDATVNRLLNEAYEELCDLEEWPFLETTTTGTGTVAITDVRLIESVYDTDQRRPLAYTTRERLLQARYDLAQTGSPSMYWIDAGATIRAWPVGGSLSVRYLMVPPLLTVDSDTPVVPQRYRDIIVTGAVRKALLDDSASEDYQAVAAEYDRRVATMRTLLDQSVDTLYVRVADAGDWC